MVFFKFCHFIAEERSILFYIDEFKLNSWKPKIVQYWIEIFTPTLTGDLAFDCEVLLTYKTETNCSIQIGLGLFWKLVAPDCLIRRQPDIRGK